MFTWMGYYQLQVTPSPLPSPPLSLLSPSFSIIVLFFVEMYMLWLVEDCIISSYNHLTQGDYSRGTFCQCYTGCDKHDRKNAIPKTTKDAYRFGITLLKRKRWWNLMNLLNSSGNSLLILIQLILTIVAEFTILSYNRIWKHLNKIILQQLFVSGSVKTVE